MQQSEILALTHCVAPEVRDRFIHVCVYEVQKCNFNDQYLICDKWLSFAELDGAPLVWFDAYLGKNGADTQEVAIAYSDREVFWVQCKTENGITAEEHEAYCDHICTVKSEGKTFLASHITIATRKW